MCIYTCAYISTDLPYFFALFSRRFVTISKLLIVFRSPYAYKFMYVIKKKCYLNAYNAYKENKFSRLTSCSLSTCYS